MAAMTLSKKAHKEVIDFSMACQAHMNKFTDYICKLQAIDRAYYGAIESIDEEIKTNTVRDIEVPIILSQVDTTTAYLADIYLTGSPIFGIVAARENRETAAKLEAIIDLHATKGRWASEFLKTFHNGAKYDFTAQECEYVPIKDLNITLSQKPSEQGEATASAQVSYINRMKSVDLYNIFMDNTVEPSKIAEYGEFVGYNDIVSTVTLKNYIQELSDAKIAINISDALKSSFTRQYINFRPQVSPYIRKLESQLFSYESFLDGGTGYTQRATNLEYSSHYKRTKLYARIIPSRLGIDTDRPNHVQIWRFIIINDAFCISAQPITVPLDLFPIVTCQFHDDGFGLQTKGIEERAMPWQDVASELINVSLKSSRRAISDRAIYDPTLINSLDVNSKDPSPKIPIKPTTQLQSSMAGNPLDNAYKAIPFDNSSTRGIMGEVNTILQLSEYLNGQSAISQGAMRPGNRTLGEVQTTISKGENRARRIALVVEDSLMLPIKYMVKANILQNLSKGKILHSGRKKEYDIDPAELAGSLLDFKVADGLQNKAQLASPQAYSTTMQTLLQIPQLAQMYDIGDIFADFVTAAGMPDIDKYRLPPQPVQQSQSPAQSQPPP